MFAEISISSNTT